MILFLPFKKNTLEKAFFFKIHSLKLLLITFYKEQVKSVGKADHYCGCERRFYI